MAASIYTGTGNFSYTNSTGGNVRIIVMSCRTDSNTLKNGTVTVGSASYPIYPNTTWGKGLVAPTGDASMIPVEYVLANGGSFSLAGASTGNPTGQELIDNSNTTDLSGNWTVPTGVNSVCVVCVGAGGYKGYGGSLAWKNHIPVTPGTTVPYQIGKKGNSSPDSARSGGNTWFVDTETVFAPGGPGSQSGHIQQAFIGDGGGNGGGSSGGGAGGYTGDGGDYPSSSNQPGGWGQGGGGGGTSASSSYGSGGGGGVGLYGQGENGQGGEPGNFPGLHGHGGSGGQDAPSANYGGGGADGGGDSWGGLAGMRIIWGDGRAFPKYNTQDDQTGTDTVILSYNVAIIPE